MSPPTSRRNKCGLLPHSEAATQLFPRAAFWGSRSAESQLLIFPMLYHPKSGLDLRQNQTVSARLTYFQLVPYLKCGQYFRAAAVLAEKRIYMLQTIVSCSPTTTTSSSYTPSAQ